jgi:hypothetical protein
VDGRNHEEEGEEGFGGASAEVDGDPSGIRTIVPHQWGSKRRMRSRWRSKKKRRRKRSVGRGE